MRIGSGSLFVQPLRLLNSTASGNPPHTPAAPSLSPPHFTVEKTINSPLLTHKIATLVSLNG